MRLCVVAWVCPSSRSRSSRVPLRLRPGLDPARLSDLDDDLEVEEFLSKNTADTDFSRFQGVSCKNPLL